MLGIVVADTVAIRIGIVGIGSGEVFRIVVESVTIKVIPAVILSVAVLVGIEGIEAVGDLPLVAHAVGIVVDCLGP